MMSFELPISLLPPRLAKAGLNEDVALRAARTEGAVAVEGMSVMRAAQSIDNSGRAEMHGTVGESVKQDKIAEESTEQEKVDESQADVIEQTPVSTEKSRCRGNSEETQILPPRMAENSQAAPIDMEAVTVSVQTVVEGIEESDALNTEQESHASSSPLGDIVEVEIGNKPAPVLESLTVRELREEAAKRNVNLSGLTKKKDILARLEAGV